MIRASCSDPRASNRNDCSSKNNDINADWIQQKMWMDVMMLMMEDSKKTARLAVTKPYEWCIYTVSQKTAPLRQVDINSSK